MDEIKVKPPAVKLDQLQIAYGRKRVINNFSLSIHPGNRLALMGSRGSGKSSLIYTMLGLVRPVGGLAMVSGFECWKQSIEVRRRCGFVAAAPAFDKEFSLNDLLNFSARLSKEKTDWDFVQTLVDRFHLDPRKRIVSLDSTQKKLIALILGFMTHAEIVFLDEPFAGLDEEGRETVNAFLEDLIPMDQTLVAAITHPSQAGKVFTEIALIQKGNLVSVVDAEKFTGLIVRKVEVTFGAKPPLEQLIKSGMIRQLSWENTTLRCFVIGPSGPFLKAIDGNEVLDIKSWEANLEETIQAVFMEEKDAS